MPTITRAPRLSRQTTLVPGHDAENLEAGSHAMSSYKDGIHNDLHRALVGSEIHDTVSKECWAWFCHYLDSSIKRDWEQIFQVLIKGLEPTPPKDASAWPEQASKVYDALKIVTDAIRSRSEVSIDEIVLELLSGDVLRIGEQDGVENTPPDRNQVRQLVWCLVGMITMLFDPKPRLHSESLCIRLPRSNLRPGSRVRRGEDPCAKQSIESCRYPLHASLAQFGELIPKVEADDTYLASVGINYINIAYINFYTLKHVANLEIEWVNTLGAHLQLDKRHRILRLFRFPAFCRLAWSENDESFMNQLYVDHLQWQVKGPLHTEHTISDYLREVMLTYRLLFGIDKHSRAAFKDELPAWREGVPSDIIPQDLRDMDDPLLLLLCTTSTDPRHHPPPTSISLHCLKDLLWWLHGEEKSGLFDRQDFPFLGRRLADLQQFSLNQKPNDLKSLFWIDRRDPQSFWNGCLAWILLVIGGGTIFLQFFQLVFQIWGTLK